MNKLDKDYQALLQDILDNGKIKGDRTGTGTLSVFGRQIRHDMSTGFPLLTTKKMPFKTVVTELLWFLRGETHVKYLLDNNCHIWDGDLYRAYEKAFNNGTATGLSPMCKGVPDEIIPKEDFIDMIKNAEELGSEEFAKKWGDLGPIYGKQWRKWEYGDDKAVKNGSTYPSGEFMYDIRKEYIDQIQVLIDTLKTDPDSRRLMVNAWNVGELDKMVLPPCHYGFQLYTRELTKEERWCLYCDTLNKLNTPSIKGSTNDETMNGYYEEYNVPKRTISLMWNQRSVDTFLGLPFNIASYAILLQIIADEVNMVPDELIGNLGDVHLYSNHLEQAKEQIEKTPYLLPTLRINTEFWNPEKVLGDNFGAVIKGIEISDFSIEGYTSHPPIKADLSN